MTIRVGEPEQLSVDRPLSRLLHDVSGTVHEPPLAKVVVHAQQPENAFASQLSTFSDVSKNDESA
jgi:hypothetical protein